MSFGNDDAYQWMGGNGTYTHLIAGPTGDDHFDLEMGFRGAVQFAVAQRAGFLPGDKCIELDNYEFNFNAPCRTNPVLANFTLVGGGFGIAINHRRGADAQIFNSILHTFGVGLRIEHFETCAGYNPQGPAFFCPATGIEELAGSGITSHGAWPNPFSTSTRIAFEVPVRTFATLEIYDVTGRRVDSILESVIDSGGHSIEWDPTRALASGSYFYVLETPEVRRMGKLLLVR